MNDEAGLVARMNRLMSLDRQADAIEFDSRWFQWGELADFLAQIDRLLSDAGLGHGTAVGILLRNRPSLLGAALSVLLSQRCVLTVSPFQSASSLSSNLTQLRAPVLFMDAQDWALPEVQAATAGAMVIVTNDGEGKLNAAVASDHEHCTMTDRHPDVPGTGILMLSSGTTGSPKRIPLAFKSFEQAILGATFYESGSNDSGLQLKRSPALLSMPLVHIGGLWTAVLNLASGRPLVLFEKFSVERFERAVIAHQPKMVSLPPTALRMLYDAGVPKASLSSLIAVRAGSAPLDPAFVQAFEDRYGVPILDAYGATEFAGGVAGWTWSDHQRWSKEKRGSVGRANKGVDLRIVDRDSGAALPPGQVGLLEVRAPQLGSADWARTTDLAELDADGFLYIRGRADDAIIRGGFKVFPATVADALRSHPAVFDASVVGMPDVRLGAVPMAAVELRPDAAAPTESELTAFLRAQLTAYQVPTRILIVPCLPRTPSMKISQPGVKALLTAETTEKKHAIT